MPRRTSHSASALFLLRPDGWEERLEGIAAAEEELSQAGTVEALRARLERMETELRSAREKAKAEGDRAESAEAEAARAKSRARKDGCAGAGIGVHPARRGRRAAAGRAATRVGRGGRADQPVAWRTCSRRAERRGKRRWRRRPRLSPAATPETARLLDDLTAALRPAAGDGEDEPEPPAAPVALPTAIPPDKADAVDWLLKQTEPLTLVVDGYNLSFLLEEPAEFASPDARERLVARLTPSAADGDGAAASDRGLRHPQ